MELPMKSELRTTGRSRPVGSASFSLPWRRCAVRLAALSGAVVLAGCAGMPGAVSPPSTPAPKPPTTVVTNPVSRVSTSIFPTKTPLRFGEKAGFMLSASTEGYGNLYLLTKYRMGEPVSIYAAADTPCYLTLVNVGSSRRVRVLLPNAAQPQNHLLPAGRTVVFPAAASKLRVSPIGPPGMETVVAVCSTDNQPVFPFGLSYGQNGFASLDDGRASVARDLAVVAAAPAPNRQVGQAAVGFVVAQ